MHFLICYVLVLRKHPLTSKPAIRTGLQKHIDAEMAQEGMELIVSNTNRASATPNCHSKIRLKT